jgi:glucan endo-1,3-alpha-glucosidase
MYKSCGLAVTRKVSSTHTPYHSLPVHTFSMKQGSFLLSLAAAASSVGVAAAQKYAFAHVVVGDTSAHTEANWENDITLAHDAALDAFALNVAWPDTDGETSTQVANAFAACEALANGFKLFFSFDYLGGGEVWPAADVISWLEEYSSSDCYFTYDDLPFVSTFEGTGNIEDWAPGGTIRSSIDVYFVPCWTSLGTAGLTPYLDYVQGFCMYCVSTSCLVSPANMIFSMQSAGTFGQMVPPI